MALRTQAPLLVWVAWGTGRRCQGRVHSRACLGPSLRHQSDHDPRDIPPAPASPWEQFGPCGLAETLPSAAGKAPASRSLCLAQNASCILSVCLSVLLLPLCHRSSPSLSRHCPARQQSPFSRGLGDEWKLSVLCPICIK